MVDGASHNMGFHPQDLQLTLDAGEAVGRWLRDRYPTHTAKHVARDLQCDVRTAENVIDGHLSKTTITRLLRAYGFSLLLHVGASVLGETYEQSIHRQLEEIADDRRRLDTQEEDLRNRHALARARGAVDGGVLRLVHPQDLDADRSEGGRR